MYWRCPLVLPPTTPFSHDPRPSLPPPRAQAWSQWPRARSQIIVHKPWQLIICQFCLPAHGKAKLPHGLTVSLVHVVAYVVPFHVSSCYTELHTLYKIVLVLSICEFVMCVHWVPNSGSTPFVRIVLWFYARFNFMNGPFASNLLHSWSNIDLNPTITATNGEKVLSRSLRCSVFSIRPWHSLTFYCARPFTLH